MYLFLLISLPLHSFILAENEFLCKNPEKITVKDNAQKSTYKNCKRNGMTWWYTDTEKMKSQVNFTDDKENGVLGSTVLYENGSHEGLIIDHDKCSLSLQDYRNLRISASISSFSIIVF